MELLTTFKVNNDLFGIEVLRVQEVTGTPVIVRVPLAPRFVLGLVNLRGQIATALGLREVFDSEGATQDCPMSVICKVDGILVSLVVDAIGDVIEVDPKSYEGPPETIPEEKRKFIKSVYKGKEGLLSILDLDALTKALTANEESVAS